MRRIAVLVLAFGAAACGRNPGVFSEQNARAHVSVLAGTIGKRPVGTEANDRARAYILDQLKMYGYEVRVQEVDARRPELGRTAHVNNIVAVLAGKRSEAIGLVSHYDSAPESPGGGDDALGWRCRSRRPACSRRGRIDNGRSSCSRPTAKRQG